MRQSLTLEREAVERSLGQIVENMIDCILFIGKGIGVTLPLLLGGFIVGLVLGTGFAILRYKKCFARVIGVIISVVRGTPLLLQLALIYFSFPTLFHLSPTILQAGILTFGWNSACYLAEIMRSGIDSLPKGQFEAAQTLHIPFFYMWRDILLPQIFRHIFPAIINEIIALLKETALIATIGGMDVMRSAQVLAAEQFSYFLPLCIAGGYYYLCVLIIERLGKWMERRLTLC